MNNNANDGYDLIGDIHGHLESLQVLLTKLGYREVGGDWQNGRRKVIFLGDFIDRGPEQRGVVELVRTMVQSGNALAVMGNHEFNAIAFNTLDAVNGRHLRRHSKKNIGQHQAFLDAYPDEAERVEVLDWFRTLPMWLDIGDFKVVHACWDKSGIEHLENKYKSDAKLTEELLFRAAQKGTLEFQVVETLLKGKELPLPNGATFRDKEGTERDHIRVRWWDKFAMTYREAYMGPESARTHIPDDDTHGGHLIEYAHDAPPVFLGHYWLDGEPTPIAANIVCLDYSVAKPGGKLAAYRWNPGEQIDQQNFVYVERVERDDQ